MAEKKQPNRWRCLVKGCNPVLDGLSAAVHKGETGHRVAKWAVRSAQGQKKADQRNRSGYYDKYNVGAKSYDVRGPLFDRNYVDPLDRVSRSDYDEDDGSWDAHSCYVEREGY